MNQGLSLRFQNQDLRTSPARIVIQRKIGLPNKTMRVFCKKISSAFALSSRDAEQPRAEQKQSPCGRFRNGISRKLNIINEIFITWRCSKKQLSSLTSIA